MHNFTGKSQTRAHIFFSEGDSHLARLSMLMRFHFCLLIFCTGLYAPSRASELSPIPPHRIVAESKNYLGWMKSLLKAELDASSGSNLKREFSFSHEIISELFDSVSQFGESNARQNFDDFSLYLAAARSVIELLVSKLQSQTGLPEQTLHFINEVKIMETYFDALIHRANQVAASSNMNYDSDGTREYIFGRRTSTTTSSSPAPPMPPAVFAKRKPTRLPAPQKPSVLLSML